MTPPVDPELHAALRDLVGPDPAWHLLAPAAHHPDPTRAHHVWRITSSAPPIVIIKILATARAFASEHHAYTRWRPHLPRGTPELLAAFPAARTLVLTHADGEPLGPATPAATCEAHWHAGKFLRALHDITDHDPDPLSLADAVARRHAAWLTRLAPHLAAAERSALQALAAEIPARFAGVARVPCHRDFAAHNWLCSGPIVRGQRTHITALAVLDFEHARLDDPLVDLAKLAADDWHDPDREAALLDGYGRDLDPGERARLHVHLALHAMATLAWAHAHRDPTWLAAGRRALDLVLSAGSTAGRTAP